MAAPSLPVTFFDRLFEVLDSTPEEGRMIVIQLLVAQGRKAKIEDVLAWVNSKTAEELSGMEKHKLMAIGTLLRDNPQDFQKFLIHKNIKLFGGVDAYVTDFLTTKDTVGRILAMPAGAGKRSAIDGAKVLLAELEKHPHLSAEKKAEVTAALERLQGAAGGKRSDRGSKRSDRGSKRSDRKSRRRGSRRQTRRQRRSFTAKRRV